MTNQQTVPCKWCGRPTSMLGTKLCDGCWELESRIEANPELARRMLAKHTETSLATGQINDMARQAGLPVSWLDNRPGSAWRELETFARLLEAQMRLIALALPLEAQRIAAFEAGWRLAAKWADRDDLPADVDSPAYIDERKAALAAIFDVIDGAKATPARGA